MVGKQGFISVTMYKGMFSSFVNSKAFWCKSVTTATMVIISWNSLQNLSMCILRKKYSTWEVQLGKIRNNWNLGLIQTSSNTNDATIPQDWLLEAPWIPYFCFSVWCQLPMAIKYCHHVTEFVLSHKPATSKISQKWSLVPLTHKQ